MRKINKVCNRSTKNDRKSEKISENDLSND